MSIAAWVCLALAYLSMSVAIGMFIGRMIRKRNHDE